MMATPRTETDMAVGAEKLTPKIPRVNGNPARDGARESTPLARGPPGGAIRLPGRESGKPETPREKCEGYKDEESERDTLEERKLKKD